MRNKPRIRFKGFTEDWEQRKLGDIATITGGGTPSTNISEYWNGDIDWYSPVEIGEKRYASGSIRKITKLGLEKSSAKILPVGTVLFTSRAGIGNTAILQVEGCTNQGFQSITPNSKELDTYFLYTMTPKLKRYGEVTGAGSTFVEVSGKQMEQMNLMIPSLDEQKHVSQLFKVMDDAITLHQRKLEKLKLAKKALLQKLFPKNGSQFPEIRFKGFTDAWEQRKLGDIATFSKGNGYSKSDLASSGDPIILYGRLYTNYETTISNVDTFVELKDKSIISQGGEVIVPASGETAEDISRASVVKNQGIIIGGDLNVIKANHLLDPTFLALTISNGEQQKELSKRAQGKSVVHLHNSDLQEVNLTFPLLNEQKEISTLFEKMDNIITLHQRKLERLQEVKKGLLQKMFV